MVMESGTSATCSVELEAASEDNGAAYLVQMLLSQQATADATGRFVREAQRLKPVRLSITDTGEQCVVIRSTGGLQVVADFKGRPATWVHAESQHVIAVTQLRLAGRALITGPLADRSFWRLLRDIMLRRVVIKGLLLHYGNTMRFLWLINVRRSG